MLLEIDEEFRSICQEIASRKVSDAEWSENESDDEFQTKHYCGGFDATEVAFCFSRFAASGEVWFQITQRQALEIALGNSVEVVVRKAEL